MPPNAPTSSSWNEDQPVVEFRNVNVTHKLRAGGLFHPDTVHAVNDISLSVKRGGAPGLVGEPDYGKFTTARIVVGLQPVISGGAIFKERLLGRSVSNRRNLGHGISVIFQDPAMALDPHMIVRDALVDSLNIHRIGSPEEREAKMRDLLHLVKLPPSALNVLPRQIFGGQRQRVIIARVLALDPGITVVDEPISAPDVSVYAQVLNLLQDLKASLGLGLVFTSHDINTVRYVSDRVAVIYFGKVLGLNTTERIFNNPQEEYTRIPPSTVPSLLDA